MAGSPNEFIYVVAAARDLVVTAASPHAFRLAPRQSPSSWYCDLDDGTPTGESDPASFVRWVCPALRVVRSTTSTPSLQLDVSRPGPHSDLGKLVARLGRLAGRWLGRLPDNDAAARFAYSDPHEVIDGPLRHRIENWPLARHGDGVVRPAELWSISTTGEGLVVGSVSWWDSAEALDHQIALAVDLADRLAGRQ